MYLKLPFFLLVTTSVSFNTQSAEKKIKESSESCDFYLQLESQLKCAIQKTNSSEYLSNYGYKYCSRFLKIRNEWPDKLNNWAKSTSLCLQEMLNNNKERINPCDQLESFAFDTHPICYKQYGYCEFSDEDLQEILKILDDTDIYNKFRQSFSQWLNIEVTCPNKNKENSGNLISKILEYFALNYPNPDKKTLNEIINLLSNSKKNKNYYSKLFFAIAKTDPTFGMITNSPNLGGNIYNYPSNTQYTGYENAGLTGDILGIRKTAEFKMDENQANTKILRDVVYNETLLKRINVELNGIK